MRLKDRVLLSVAQKSSEEMQEDRGRERRDPE